MTTRRTYRPRRRPEGTRPTRDRILTAVRELLEQGTFHEATVEDIAKQAGVARATLYQHFGSRPALVDAMCESFDENPALLALRQSTATAEFIQHVCDFWESEERVLTPLYGVAAVDDAARDLVGRQTTDRHGEIQLLLGRLAEAGALAAGVKEHEAFAILAMLTSFETYIELRRRVGMPLPMVVRILQGEAEHLVAKPAADA